MPRPLPTQPALHAVGDATAVSVTYATLTNTLPSVAAIFTIVWTAIRIYETYTIRKLLKLGTTKDADGAYPQQRHLQKPETRDGSQEEGRKEAE